MSATLTGVKQALGVTGEYQDDTLTVYFNDVVDFIGGAGVSDSYITDALVARGVSDLWNYGSGDGKLSPYFIQRVTQLAQK